MNRSPTPDGMFAPHFVGVRWYFTECLLVSCGVFCVYFVGVRNVIAIRQQHFGKPFAAVGVRFIVPAYTYSQRIRNPFRIHSRNVRHAFRGRTLHY